MNLSDRRTPHTPRARTRRAFTLIEILIVIALSAILFTLLLIPLVNGIKYARQAQSLTAAQDAARITRERIERELGSAVYVFDNTSHPFLLAATKGSPNPQFGQGDDQFTNFLDLEIPQAGTNTNTGAPNSIVGHAYNAKLDFVLPRLNSNGNPIDPTTGEPIRVGTSSTSGSPIISDPSQIFPAAAGTTMIRYWVGLKDPTKPYNNNREEKTNVATDNLYVLYRAQFRLTNDLDATTKKPIANADKTTINEKLFAPKQDASNNPINEPELDDPDFFRLVADSDVDWLDATHQTYGKLGLTAAHNARVLTWQTIAKPVIPGPNVDLILLPHKSDGSLNYDAGTAAACTATDCPGTAHSGIAHDPIAGGSYPIVNTSVTFRPGVVSGDATPATTTNHSGQGVVAGTDQNGFSYVPTLYTSGSQSWAKPYVVTLTPPAAPSSPAGQMAGGAAYYVQQDPVTGDFYEYQGASPNGTPVFDVTTGQAATGVTSYVPLTINAGTGTINFGTPALPDPANRYNRQWVYAPASATLDLKATDTNSRVSPLGTIVDPQYPTYQTDAGTTQPLYTGRIVPGSLRVYGPDASQGPGRGQPVLYTEVSNLATPGDNQYVVDYVNSTLNFTGNDAAATFNGSETVSVSYDYQANETPVGTVTSGKMQSGFTLLPMSVGVNYQTRDLIDVAIGVRIYNVSTDRAEVIPAETKIKVGNSNR